MDLFDAVQEFFSNAKLPRETIASFVAYKGTLSPLFFS